MRILIVLQHYFFGGDKKLDKSKLYELIGSYNDEMLELWKNLVNVDSGPDNHEGVKKVSDIVAEFLRNIGFLTRTINFPNAGNMLVAEYGDMTKPFVIITGHMDTVFNKGAATTRAFKIEAGKAYGPGVLDMKGGITIALFVLKALLAMNYRKHPIKIIFAGDEEIGHSCSTAPQEFIKEGIGAFAAFNMETGFPDNGLVVERKGMLQQPAKPQEPQFAPGKRAAISSIRGSVSTANLRPAIAKTRPKIPPKTATRMTAFCILFQLLNQCIPLIPIRAMDIQLAVIKAIGKFLMHWGISGPSRRSLKQEKSTIAIV